MTEELQKRMEVDETVTNPVGGQRAPNLNNPFEMLNLRDIHNFCKVSGQKGLWFIT